MNTKPASYVVRFWRLFRLGIHALRAMWILRVVFPRTDEARHDEEIKIWSQGLLRVLGLKLDTITGPQPLPSRAVLVANHISWLDIFVIYAHTPGLFIAKSEIRSWPLVGDLIHRVGTLFIERGSPRHARAINAQMVEVISAGRLMCLFPEGLTTEGDELKPFHAALFQPAIEASADLVPVALRYTDERGDLCTAASYAGETTMAESIWRIVSQRELHVQVRFLPVLSSSKTARRALARCTEELIAAALSLPKPRKGTERRDDLPDAQPSEHLPIHNPYQAPTD